MMFKPATDARNRVVGFWLAGAAVTLGAGLCLYQLGVESLWLDEAAGLQAARVPLSQLLQVIRETEVFPPFYFFALHSWMSVLGDSEFSIRLLSALAAIISLAIFYQIGRRLVGWQLAAASILSLATSPFFIDHAQEARPYSFVVLFTAASFFGFLLFQNKPSWRAALLYIGSSLFLIYTHYHGLAVLAAQNFLWLMYWIARVQPGSRWLALRRWLVVQSAILLAFALWAVNLPLQLQHVSSEVWRVPPTLLTVYAAFVEYTWSQPVLGVMLYVMVLLAWVLVRPALIRTRPVNVWLGSKATFPFAWSLTVVAIWLIAPHLIAIVVSYVVTPVYLPRYTIAALPALYLLFGLGVYRLFGNWLRYALIALVVALQGVSLYTYYAGVTRDQWREVVAQVESSACPGDAVIFYMYYGRLGYGYYAHRTDLRLESFSTTEVGDPENVQQKLRDTNRFWLIEYQAENPEAVTSAVEASGFALSEATHYFHITVDLFESGQPTTCP